MAVLPTLLLACALVQGPGDDVPAKFRPTAPAPGTVVARVGGVEIKASDVENLLWDWRGFDAIQDLISYQVVKAEAGRLRLNVSDEEVERVMNDAMKQMQASLQPGQSAETALLAQGFTKSRLFLRYRTEALLNAIIEKTFDPKALIKVSTIVVRPDNEQATSMAAAITKAQSVYDRLKKGESWATVLATTTNDPNVRKANGLIGWRDIAIFPPTVKAELEGLKVGEITKPARTENGFQVFRVDALGKDAKGQDLQEMKAAFVNGSKKNMLEHLRAEAHIERLYPPIPGLNPQKDGN